MGTRSCPSVGLTAWTSSLAPDSMKPWPEWPRRAVDQDQSVQYGMKPVWYLDITQGHDWADHTPPTTSSRKLSLKPPRPASLGPRRPISAYLVAALSVWPMVSGNFAAMSIVDTEQGNEVLVVCKPL